MTREKEIYKVTLVGSAGNAALLTFKFIAGLRYRHPRAGLREHQRQAAG